MTDLQKLRDELAKDYSKFKFINGINEAIYKDFKEGFDACYKEMQAENDELNYALKFQTNSLDREMNMTEKLQIENNSLKQALDLAVCGILAIKDYTSLHEQRKEKWDVQYIYGIEQKINETLTSINEIINKTKQGESNG